MRATVQVKEVTSKKWMIPLIIFICSIIFEILLGNTLFYHSYNSIRGVQKFFNEKLHMEIFNNDNDKNLQQENILINNYLSFQKEGNNTNKKTPSLALVFLVKLLIFLIQIYFC